MSAARPESLLRSILDGVRIVSGLRIERLSEVKLVDERSRLMVVVLPRRDS
jgi:hypothetical protein